MNKPAHYYDPYDWLAPYYDWMARVLLVPFGGETRFRRRGIEALDITPGDEVLELGCGTGRMTRHLLAALARVTAIDLSPPMLERARRAAPGARILEHDILEFEGDGRFDRVLLSFVLHEMQHDIRAQALRVATEAVRPGGLVGVLDFAGHAPPPIDRVFRAYLRVAEPEMAGELLADALPSELEQAGLKLVRRVPLAAGTAQMLVGRRD